MYFSSKLSVSINFQFVRIAIWKSNLTHSGLVTPYADIDLGQHCFRWWLAAWWHQIIIWINVDLSLMESYQPNEYLVPPSSTESYLGLNHPDPLSPYLPAPHPCQHPGNLQRQCYVPESAYAWQNPAKKFSMSTLTYSVAQWISHTKLIRNCRPVIY